MKFCSVCLKCFDDSDTICSADEGHGSLEWSRKGNRLVVEGYRIESRLESDSPVERFRATQTATKKRVLLQFIEPHGSVSQIEAQLSKAANREHPNLTAVLEFGRVSKTELFVILEEVPGQSLFEYLAKSSPLQELQAIRIVRQLAEGLEVLHADGLVHGGMNPQCILVSDNDKNVKLTRYDFGGSGAASDCSRRYFSPEQLAGAEVDFRSDLYSLALVFYEMLIGKLPYDPVDGEAVLGYVFDKLDVWHLNVELRALIAHSLGESLRKRVELRPKTTNIFVRQMRHLEQVANRIDKAGRESGVESPREFVPVSIPSKPVSEQAPIPISSPKPEPTSNEPVFLGSIDIEGTVEPADEVSVDQSSDFVEVPIGPGMLAEPVKSEAGRPLPRNGRFRTMLYVVGLLVSAVLGGVITSSIFDSPNWAATEAERSAEKESKTKKVNVPEKTQVVKLVNGPEADQADRDDAFERARDLDQVTDEVSTKVIVPRRTGSKSKSSRKTQKPKRRVKRKSRKRSKRSSAKKPEKLTRPRYVKDVIIYY